MWGIIRHKVASGGFSYTVFGQSVQRTRCPVLVARCYVTAGKEGSYTISNRVFLQNGEYVLFFRPCDLVEAVVPFMGESITDGTLAKFLKKPGDRVEVDEPIAQVETDKVTIDVASPEAGIIQKFVAKEGDTVEPGTKIALISKSGEGGEGVTHTAPSPSEEAPPQQLPPREKEHVEKQIPKADVTHTAPSEEVPPQPPPPRGKEHVEKQIPKAETTLIKENDKPPSLPPPRTTASEPQLPPKDRERRVPMTRLRKRVAQHLKDSQNTFAMLTTFNEIDMTNLMKLHSDYKDAFVEKHGVKLGLMSGFVEAAVSGLQNQPTVNAVIDGDDIIYRDYIDISIAVGTPKLGIPWAWTR